MSVDVVIFSNADPDAKEIGALYRLGRRSMIDSVHHLIEAGQRLAEKKDVLGHGNWLPWLSENEEILGFGEFTARRLLKAGTFKSVVNDRYDENEALRLNRLIWGNNVRGTEGTGENEWFTPAEYIERARAVLGSIDLDPATHEAAQAVVGAKSYFTKAENGLQRQWNGRVWLNPPYAQPLIAQFVSKFVAECIAGRIIAGIMLTHNYTDTAWFHEAVSIARAICFTRGRVKFYEPDGDIAAPTQGQAFFYFGDDAAKFAAQFGPIGFVLVPHEYSRQQAIQDRPDW